MANILGQLLLVLSLTMLLPMLVGLYYQEAAGELARAYLLPMVGTILIGSSMWLPTRQLAAHERLRDRESFVIVASLWLLIAAVGSLPYILEGTLGPIEAYFESMSGFTTTGITMLDGSHIDAQGYFNAPRSLLFWRAETQWLGGMGIIVFATVILSQLIEGANHLIRAEVPGMEETPRLRPKVAQTGRLLLSIYIIFTLAETLSLMAVGLPPYDAITHAFTTLPSGGFSPKGASILYYDSLAVEAVVMVFMFIAGVNFVLFYLAFAQLRRGSTRPPAGTGPERAGGLEEQAPVVPGQIAPAPLAGRLRRALSVFGANSEFTSYLVIVGLVTLLITGLLVLEQGAQAGPALRGSLFTVLSVISTTGYTTVDFGGWPSAAAFLLLLLMFSGACAGSTAGGIKLVRFLVLVKGLHRDFVRALHPRSVRPVRLDGQSLPEEVVSKVSFFFFSYMFIFLLGTMLVLIFEPDWSFVEGMSAVATSMANIGPGLGLAGPSFVFAQVTAETKVMLIFLMWVGRLEIITALMLFFPSTYTE